MALSVVVRLGIERLSVSPVMVRIWLSEPRRIARSGTTRQPATQPDRPQLSACIEELLDLSDVQAELARHRARFDARLERRTYGVHLGRGNGRCRGPRGLPPRRLQPPTGFRDRTFRYLHWCQSAPLSLSTKSPEKIQKTAILKPVQTGQQLDCRCPRIVNSGNLGRLSRLSGGRLGRPPPTPAGRRECKEVRTLRLPLLR